MWFQNIFRGKFPRPERQPRDESGVEPVLSAQVLRLLEHLQLSANRGLPGLQSGMRPSRRQKPSYDFRDHRQYVPGDDARMIDWKASARQEHIFIRQGEQPKDVPVFLLLDCSRSMAWGQPPKREALLQVAAALGYLALAHGDRLTVLPFAEKLQAPLGPISGKGQVPALLAYLRGREFAGQTGLAAVLEYFSAHAARGGLVILLSDFLELRGLETSLAFLPEPAWDVVCIQLLHPDELQPPQSGDWELEDCESGRRANYDLTREAARQYQRHFSDWQEELDRLCDEHNAFFTWVSTGGSLDKDILPHLVDARVVRPL